PVIFYLSRGLGRVRTPVREPGHARSPVGGKRGTPDLSGREMVREPNGRLIIEETHSDPRRQLRRSLHGLPPGTALLATAGRAQGVATALLPVFPERCWLPGARQQCDPGFGCPAFGRHLPDGW